MWWQGQRGAIDDADDLDHDDGAVELGAGVSHGKEHQPHRRQ
jgi:hypothetical protein